MPERQGVRYLAGDVQDLGQVYGALAGADAVIHLAGIHTHGIVSNEETFRINAMGTFNVHEAAWRLGIPRVVTMSSEAVLGWAPGSWEREHVPAYLPIDEDHPVGAQDAYGLSKVVCEATARSYTAKCGMETVILRPPWIVSPEELDGLRCSGGVTPVRFGLYHYIDSRDLAAACRAAIERPLAGVPYVVRRVRRKHRRGALVHALSQSDARDRRQGERPYGDSWARLDRARPDPARLGVDTFVAARTRGSSRLSSRPVSGQ